jgi:hypothetical protein
MRAFVLAFWVVRLLINLFVNQKMILVHFRNYLLSNLIIWLSLSWSILSWLSRWLVLISYIIIPLNYIVSFLCSALLYIHFFSFGWWTQGFLNDAFKVISKCSFHFKNVVLVWIGINNWFQIYFSSLNIAGLLLSFFSIFEHLGDCVVHFVHYLFVLSFVRSDIDYILNYWRPTGSCSDTCNFVKIISSCSIHLSWGWLIFYLNLWGWGV